MALTWGHHSGLAQKWYLTWLSGTRFSDSFSSSSTDLINDLVDYLYYSAWPFFTSYFILALSRVSLRFMPCITNQVAIWPLFAIFMLVLIQLYQLQYV